MSKGRLVGTTLVVALTLAGCARPTEQGDVPQPAAGVAVEAADVVAPAGPFAVGVRRLSLRRGANRSLPTIVWYPAVGQPGGKPLDGAAPAPGRFPLVLFSHGLHSLPSSYESLTVRWAAAGFMVAAPAYPHTKLGAREFDRTDVANQPADALAVVADVLGLGGRPDDAFAGHLDPAHVCAAGHSAGGHTTVGLFTAAHAAWLRCGVVIAGARLSGTFTDPAAAMLFVHGNRDPTVTYARGQDAYHRVPWPKAFLTLLGQHHGEYLGAKAKGFDEVAATTTDFLRWSLYGDATAQHRLAADGNHPGVSHLVSRLF